MAKVLSPTQLSQYRRQGLTFPVRVLSPDQAGHYRGCCDDLERRLGGKPRTVQVEIVTQNIQQRSRGIDIDCVNLGVHRQCDFAHASFSL